LKINLFVGTVSELCNVLGFPLSLTE
jgi:hypothetical protein